MTFPFDSFLSFTDEASGRAVSRLFICLFPDRSDAVPSISSPAAPSQNLIRLTNSLFFLPYSNDISPSITAMHPDSYRLVT